MATGLPELDRNLNYMLKKLPTYNSEVNSNTRKVGKENYIVLKRILEKEIMKLPPSDMRDEMAEGLNLWTKNIDNLTRHGAIFEGINPLHATEEEKHNYKMNYILPIIKQPESMLRFTRAMKVVATSYVKNKNQNDFVAELTNSVMPKR